MPPPGPPMPPPGPPGQTLGPPAPPPGPPGTPPPDLVTVLQAIESALTESGVAEIAEITELIRLAEGGQAPPPEMVESVVNQLASMGGQGMARALLMALGVQV
jgi:hypothetical protein